MTTTEMLLQAFAQWRMETAAEKPGFSEAFHARLLSNLTGEESDATLFDGAWYAARNKVPPRKDGRAAINQYLKAGAVQGSDPTRWFSEAEYRELYPDVAQAVARGEWRCGYQHYLLAGMAEMRSPSAGFSELAYLGCNLDILQAVRAGEIPSGLLHFIRFGKAEGRLLRKGEPDRMPELPAVRLPVGIASSDSFDEALYRRLNPDVDRPGQGPSAGLEHWLQSGMAEDLRGVRGRMPGWSDTLYLRRNPDLGRQFGGPGQPSGFSHYLMYGSSEERSWAGQAWERTEAALLARAMRPGGGGAAGLPDGEASVISVITPVFNPDIAALQACIDSVRAQSYPYWQLCLADDGSASPEVVEVLTAAARADRRVRVAFAPRNEGISAASNRALALADGAIVALLDHDDVLMPDALGHVAAAFASGPEVDLVYTDEAKLTEDGLPVQLSTKPGWSPELLLSTMYIGHLTAYRRSVVLEVGGFRSAFDGTQDYDLALRMAEVVRQAVHVPVPLYLWRMSAASTAGSMGAKAGVLALQARALESALVRRGQMGSVRPGHLPGHWSVVLDPPAELPLVSIVIPTAGRRATIGGIEIDLVVNCVRSLMGSERYPRLEVVLVHNGDLQGSTLLQLANHPHLRLVAYEGVPFNLSDKINLGVREAAGEFVLLLNDDMQAESRDIVGSMMGRMFEGVGLVGGRLLFANGLLQHAGVVWTGDGPTHAMIGEHRLSAGPAERLRVLHDVFGVSGACMFFRRSVFLECGGFSPALPINYNDVELCLKVRERGLRVVFDPEVTLFHFESLSKTGTHFWELQQLLLRHPGVHDPYWNAMLSDRSPFFELRDPAAAELPSYRAWLLRRIAGRQAGLTVARDVRFSVIMSVFNNRRDQMEALAETVARQTYGNWEWVIVDDGSSRKETLAWLDTMEGRPGVRVVRRAENGGIMAGYGEAFRAATGEYVVPVDADDLLTLDCLHVLATAVERFGRPEVVYSDEDKATEAGDTHSPFLKPDWDPVLFSNICYVCHVCAIRRDAGEAAGIYTDPAASWCHDWDTLLRIKRAGGRIEHVPEVLYHWRIHPGSTASIETGTKPHTIDSQLHVQRQDLRLRGTEGLFDVVQNELFPHTGIWRLRPLPRAMPHSAVLVVAAAEPERTGRFLDALAGMQRPADCPVLLVDEDGLGLGAALSESAGALWPDGVPLVFPSLVTAVAECARQERTVAVADAAVQEVNRSWVPELLGMFAAADDVAAVGGSVADTAGRVVWRGGMAGFGGGIGSPDHGMPDGEAGYHGIGWCQRSCDGVSAMCFAVRVELLEQAVAEAGAEPSLRVLAGRIAVLARQAGRRVIHTPFARAVVEQGTPVGPLPPPDAAEAFRSGPVFHASAFGRTVETAYRLG